MYNHADMGQENNATTFKTISRYESFFRQSTSFLRLVCMPNSCLNTSRLHVKLSTVYHAFMTLFQGNISSIGTLAYFGYKSYKLDLILVTFYKLHSYVDTSRL